MAEHFTNPDQVAAYTAMQAPAAELVAKALEFARMPGVTDIRAEDDKETAILFQALSSTVPALANQAHTLGASPHLIIAAMAAGMAQCLHQTSEPRAALNDFADALSDAMNQCAELDDAIRAAGPSN